MQVRAGDKAWNPTENRRYLTLIPEGYQPPTTMDQMIALQEGMVGRLIAQAEEDQGLAYAEAELQDLPAPIRISLPDPGATWRNRNLPKVMMHLSPTMWMQGAYNAVDEKVPATEDPELMEALEEMGLVDWMQTILN